MFHHQFKVFRRNAVNQRQGGFDTGHQNDRAKLTPAGAGNGGARQGFQLPLHRLFNSFGQRLVIGDQHRLRCGVMLGLRQKIGGNPVRICVLVRNNQHLGRAGNHINTHSAEHPALGGGNKGIARPDNFGHGGDGVRAIGERGHSLRAADTIDFINTRQIGGGQHQRIDVAVGGGNHHHHARAPRHLGRNGIHQHGRGIAGCAAGHIKTNGLNSGPAPAQLHTQIIGKAHILRNLALMKGQNPRPGHIQRRQRLRRAGCAGRRNFACADAYSGGSQSKTIKFLCIVEQCCVTARTHIA